MSSPPEAPTQPTDHVAIDSVRFRAALGQFPSGVTIVTGRDELGPVGLSVQSFCSLSLDPPLVLLCPSLSSTSWPRISAAGTLCVNILSDDQDELCRQLGRSDPAKFDGVAHSASPRYGLPILDGAVGWLECVLHSTADGGDHLIVTARVVDHSEPTYASPLMFWRGQFTRLVTD